MVPGQRDEPQREFREIDSRRVAVKAIQATLRDQPPREDDLVLVGGNLWQRVMSMPGLDERVAQLAAGFDKKGARTHGRVADTEVQNLLRARDPIRAAAQSPKDRFECSAHDGFGQFARRVVRAGAPPLFTGLQDHRAPGDHIRGRGLVDRRIERPWRRPAPPGIRAAARRARAAPVPTTVR